MVSMSQRTINVEDLKEKTGEVPKGMEIDTDKSKESKKLPHDVKIKKPRTPSQIPFKMDQSLGFLEKLTKNLKKLKKRFKLYEESLTEFHKKLEEYHKDVAITKEERNLIKRISNNSKKRKERKKARKMKKSSIAQDPIDK